MTILNTSQDAAAWDARIKELTEENALLFEQLHVVQEELEKYYHKLNECEQREGAKTSSGHWDSRLSDVLAENHKLRILAELWQQVSRVETQNSLQSRLGDLLIKGVSSTGAFLTLPGKLRKEWKALEQTAPPAVFGGQSFQKIINAYNIGGLNAAEELLGSVFISSVMRANAYTALARHLMPSSQEKAAEIARLAYETDPRPYRLKWLAFRIHDASDAITAEAMLDMLPADITLSDSEQRQAIRIRRESAHQRKMKAEKDAAVQEFKAAENKKIAQLAEQVEKHRHEAERLRELQVELQKLVDHNQTDLEELRAHLAEQKTLVDKREEERNALQLRLVEQESIAESSIKEIDALKILQTDLNALVNNHKMEAEMLILRLADREILTEERKKEVDRLTVHIDKMHKLYHDEVKPIVSQQKKIIETIMSYDLTLENNFEQHNLELKRISRYIQSSNKQEIDKALQQSVAYNGLTEYFKSGKLPQVTPWKRGWAASPDFILWLVELIERNDYDLVLEFGSGITTLYTAKTLAARKRKNIATKNASVVSFDHLEQFFLQTKALLSEHGLVERINLIHAPLQEYTAPDGTVYQYYSCRKTLAELSYNYKSVNSRILVLVDGPPASTDKNARYPAFPLVMKYLAPAQIDFLLDDYSRHDETELAKMWQVACGTAGIEHTAVEKQLEKGALLLRLIPSHAEQK